MLTSTTNVKRHTENGVTTDFPFDFKVDSPTELQVDSIDLAGVPTRLSYPGDFTVTGLHDNDGGYIKKVAGTNGFDLLIRRVTPTTQTTKLRGQTALDPVVLEDALDKLTKIAQQQTEELSRVVRFSVGGLDINMPNPSPLAFLRWNESGGGLENYPFDEVARVGHANTWTASQNFIGGINTPTIHGTSIVASGVQSITGQWDGSASWPMAINVGPMGVLSIEGSIDFTGDLTKNGVPFSSGVSLNEENTWNAVQHFDGGMTAQDGVFSKGIFTGGLGGDGGFQGGVSINDGSGVERAILTVDIFSANETKLQSLDSLGALIDDAIVVPNTTVDDPILLNRDIKLPATRGFLLGALAKIYESAGTIILDPDENVSVQGGLNVSGNITQNGNLVAFDILSKLRNSEITLTHLANGGTLQTDTIYKCTDAGPYTLNYKAPNPVDNAGKMVAIRVAPSFAYTTTINPYDSELINGGTSVVLNGGDCLILKSDGTVWDAIVLSRSKNSSTSRELLTAARTYYVRTDGNDSNTGLENTAGGAFLTIQKAIDTVCDKLDTQSYQVTIQVADGTYTSASILCSLRPYVGRVTPIIQGNTATPASCLLSVANHCFYATKSCWLVKGFKITTTNNGIALISDEMASLRFANLEFGACSGQHIFAKGSSRIQVESNYTISGGCAHHIVAESAGVVSNLGAGRTITLTGSPEVGTFALAQTCGSILYGGNTYIGAAGGTRHTVTTGGFAQSGGTQFPGSIAGSISTNGYYTA